VGKIKGIFITLDGPSGVGKTTMAGRLADLLSHGRRAVTATAEPSTSAIGELARYGTHEYHGRTLSCLIAADRYHHVESVIEPALERREIVICDRYFPSSLVLDQMDSVPFDFIWSTYQGLRWPDLSIFLSADPEVCGQRAAARGNHSRFHQTDLAGRRQEAALFEKVASELARRGYPVIAHDISDQSPEAASLSVAQLATARLGL
jgi:dTMP kinase